MAGDWASGRYRAWYAGLLRLYPRPFRVRFGEAMAQTFGDLCREQRGVAWMLPVFCETFAGMIRENMMYMPDLGRTMVRVALGALVALMAPLVGSRVVPGWNWPVKAFVLVYVLFFLTGMAYALISRRMGAWSYKAGVGVALVAGFAFGWSNMVHTSESDNPANLLYFSVLAVGCVGAWLARLRAGGLAWTLFAMVATLGVVAVMVPSGAPPYHERNAVGHVAYAVLFGVAGLLFRHANRAAGPAAP
ncbi:MAG: hypothetical protein FJW40_05640 [Acidobacteria bacterium]|nr:hypothetical protein [Acidobacteriota bacterium]